MVSSLWPLVLWSALAVAAGAGVAAAWPSRRKQAHSRSLTHAPHLPEFYSLHQQPVTIHPERHTFSLPGGLQAEASVCLGSSASLLLGARRGNHWSHWIRWGHWRRGCRRGACHGLPHAGNTKPETINTKCPPTHKSLSLLPTR